MSGVESHADLHPCGVCSITGEVLVGSTPGGALFNSSDAVFLF